MNMHRYIDVPISRNWAEDVKFTRNWDTFYTDKASHMSVWKNINIMKSWSLGWHYSDHNIFLYSVFVDLEDIEIEGDDW